MDEMIEKYSGNKIDISDVSLNNDKNIKLLRGFEVDESARKKYMRNIVIMVDDEFITSNMADTMIFKEELALFNFGDKQNKYLVPSSRKIEQENVNSLDLTLSDGKVIHIARSEAKAMVGLWNLALKGYSFVRLLEFEKEQTLETWTVALKVNGYLQLSE